MNQVSKIPANQPARTVAGIPVPAASRWLVEAMAEIANPHPDIGRDLAAIRPGVRQEAARAAEAMAPLLEPASVAQWAAFLLPLRVLPNSPTSRDGLDAAARTFAFAMSDVPACCLTANHQREALRSLRFWPTPHDLDKVLRDAVSTLKAEYRNLTLVAKAPETPATAQMSEAERERIAAGMASLVSELTARSIASEQRDITASRKPSVLSDGALLAAYERQAQDGGPGAEAAASRAAAIRARLEAAQ